MGMMTANNFLIMATPGELIRAVAEGTGLPEATVFLYDRAIAEAGLRSKAGRGGKSAKVTARDAAHLLTAILGSGQVKDSVHSVQRYLETRPHLPTSSARRFKDIGIDELARLPAQHSFIDALEALIASAAAGSLAQWLGEQAKGTRARPVDVAPIIEVSALTPGTIGDIRIAGTRKGMTAALRYALPDPWSGRSAKTPPKAELDTWEAKIKEFRADTDLEQFRRVSAKTILRVAEALAAGSKT